MVRKPMENAGADSRLETGCFPVPVGTLYVAAGPGPKLPLPMADRLEDPNPNVGMDLDCDSTCLPMDVAPPNAAGPGVLVAPGPAGRLEPRVYAGSELWVGGVHGKHGQPHSGRKAADSRQYARLCGEDLAAH